MGVRTTHPAIFLNDATVLSFYSYRPYTFFLKKKRWLHFNKHYFYLSFSGIFQLLLDCFNHVSINILTYNRL